jgi:hypothetical protein
MGRSSSLVIGFAFIFICIAAYFYIGRYRTSVEGFASEQDDLAALRLVRKNAIENDTELIAQKSLYSTLINSLEPAERYLVNLCPLTASLGGYIGVGEPGVFYSEIYVQRALRAGIRSFVLPISTYIDDNKSPPNWPLSGEPAIVCRDANGKIISKNGLSIKNLCNHLMSYMAENSSQADEPIILYIHETDGYVPDRIMDEQKYVKLLSKIAKELDTIPVNRRLTNLGGYGSGVGSSNESAILTQIPLTDLKNKFIVITNFDTKLALKTAYTGITPTLDSYTNFTVKPVVAANAGLNVSAGNNTRSLKLADVKSTRVNWGDQARTVWHMTTQDNPLVTPVAADVNAATLAGIQMIPVPFYMTNAIAEVKPIWDTWQGYAWRLKPSAARYLKPAPVVPQAPSAKMNARVDSSLQPGQLAVQ